MILYKYTDIDTADLIINNATLKFSSAASLNDPFELSGMAYSSRNGMTFDNVKYNEMAIFFGILSLTRNPLNPLMWAHYGRGKKIIRKEKFYLDFENNSHAGIVFGIDVNEAKLNCINDNLIPAKFGSVIYTTTKPTTPFDNSTGAEYWFNDSKVSSFNPNNLEALQRTFLYKPSHWSYEEEVRVVRSTSRTNCDNLITITPSCFKEVYLGIRNSNDYKYLSSMREKIKSRLPDCNIFVCGYDKFTWAFQKLGIEDALNLCD